MAQERRVSSITPKSRGVTWPKLWWQPEIDSTVFFFLGTADERFDALATLTMLEAREYELMGSTAAVLARGNANDAHVGSSQVKRAEAGKETKAKSNG